MRRPIVLRNHSNALDAAKNLNWPLYSNSTKGYTLKKNHSIELKLRGYYTCSSFLLLHPFLDDCVVHPWVPCLPDVKGQISAGSLSFGQAWPQWGKILATPRKDSSWTRKWVSDEWVDSDPSNQAPDKTHHNQAIPHWSSSDDFLPGKEEKKFLQAHQNTNTSI